MNRKRVVKAILYLLEIFLSGIAMCGFALIAAYFAFREKNIASIIATIIFMIFSLKFLSFYIPEIECDEMQE